MYLLPGNWSIPLLKIKSIEIENDLIKENPFKHILLNHGNSGTEDEMIMRISFTALLYLSLEDNIYDYLSYLKSVILNKVTGIMNGDYEIWEKLYDVCLKIYSKKGQVRKNKKLEVDQLLEQQNIDNQFINFLKKVEMEEVNLSSLNFFIKNTPRASREELKPIVMKKIINLLEKEPWKYAEDIFEYV